MTGVQSFDKPLSLSVRHEYGTSSHEFEFEYGDFGVFKFMIIRRHSIQTHDNFAAKTHEFEYFHE